jgi:GT2 family glycosyltransferase
MSLSPDIKDIVVVIPVFNQLHFTQNCLDSLARAGVAEAQIVIVNNGSTDGTREFLAARPGLRAIHNAENCGCGHAWTQGAKMSAAPWTVMLNNDVLVPPGCLEGLLRFAEEEQFDVVSPAMCEGDADYDFLKFNGEFIQKMAAAHRPDVAHGVCFMVRRRVFETVGYFNNFGGYEDDDFFRRARRAGFRLAITGRAALHHFGSVTQNSIKQQSHGTLKSLGDREYYRRETGQVWLKRKTLQLRDFLRSIWWRHSERLRYGHTLREQRIAGTVKYL